MEYREEIEKLYNLTHAEFDYIFGIIHLTNYEDFSEESLGQWFQCAPSKIAEAAFNIVTDKLITYSVALREQIILAS